MNQKMKNNLTFKRSIAIMITVTLATIASTLASTQSPTERKEPQMQTFLSETANLSGVWRIRSLDPKETESHEFMLERTDIKKCLNADCTETSVFYRALTGGVPMGHWNLIGINMSQPRKGHETIQFTRAKEGPTLDCEFAMILRQEMDDNGEYKFILGGDFEEEELSIMERVPGWK